MTARTNAGECSFVDTWLDGWLSGRLPAAAAQRIEAHVRTCERCRRLASIVRNAGADPGALQDADGEIDLLPRVMAETTGSACARAQELLPSLADADLEAGTRALLESHVSHCEPCSALLGVLQASREVLPALAEMTPPPGFAQRVFAATSRGRRRSAFAEWWLRVLERPRASLELAYVGALLIVVLFGTNPVAAFRDAGENAGRIAVEQIPTGAAVGVVQQALATVTSAAQVIGNEIAEVWRQVTVLLGEIESTAARAAEWLLTIDLRQLVGRAEQEVRPSAAPANAPPARQ